MARKHRIQTPHLVRHVMARGNGRMAIFLDDLDYRTFTQLFRETVEDFKIECWNYCAMPNHFHLVLRPNERRALSAYMHWLTSTHVRRLHRRNGTVGEGHIYQERYRTVAVATTFSPRRYGDQQSYIGVMFGRSTSANSSR